ncbi:peptidoglycan/xylan/chitin deacetylase (PgdA/CDA1 family) [Methylobacterium sp. BE186]|uniref:DUF4214 domain-containing protein n=1 Tax=Methylobacterium sp. BE186 TaxID=2817715 RepID=UPI0028543B69|nr:DUF4214 domain-containing protein [Methylobacterium sp. BE186]MDR7038072.1 peptidoglycan/xylan/chitin deacetylase (PgdA/CDA1 family) [Methylobacterium sp. BE186]
MSTITLDGSLQQDWTASDLIDTTAPVAGYSVYGKFDASTNIYFLALQLSTAAGAQQTSFGPNTTIWLNADRNVTTGYQVFGNSVGAEYKIEFGADGNPSLFALDPATGNGTPIQNGVQFAFSANKQTVELAVPQSNLVPPGTTSAPGTLPGLGIALDVNDSNVFLPSSFAQQYTIRAPAAHINDGQLRVGIVYSETSAAKYFNTTAYSDLFMSAQNQATMAGIPYDVLSEADLTNIDKLKKYDTLIFPSFANVKQAELSTIQNTLSDAVYKYGVSLIAAGNFMTNDENNTAFAGDSYARMKLLLGVQRDGGDNVSTDQVTAAGNSAGIIGYAAGTPIHTYTENATSKVGTAYFSGVDPSAQVVATQTTTGGAASGPFNAVLATHTGSNNVFFSTEGMLADSNMLAHALDYTIQSQKPAGPELSLQMSRFASIVATRVDMDQAMYPEDVEPTAGPGIYDKFLPIVQQWKQAYNFAGSYYVDIGNGQTDTYASDTIAGTSASLNKSAEFYKQLIALGGEIGSHTMTHPEDTNATTVDLAYQFGASKTLIEKYLSGYTVVGAALPGAPETLSTDENIYAAAPGYSYITGRYTGVGSNYPGAIGYLTPSQTDTQHIFLAPNMKADFSLVEAAPEFGGGMSALQATAEWQKEFDDLSSHSDLPVAIWTWHDYGAAMWPTNGPGTTSPYTTDMYTSFINYAYSKGGEFVTLADLAERVAASEKATFDYNYNSATNTVTANINGSNLGNFALDLDAGSHIASVSTNTGQWYAYDDDSVFLPASATNMSYNIQLGTSASRVTHITSLPMRADLVSLSGDGRNLSFQVTGDGQVTLDLADPNGQPVTVTGATIVSQTQDTAGARLVLSLAGLTTHDVVVKLGTPPAADIVPPTVTLSADPTSLKAGQTAAVAFTFSEAVTGFDAQDLSVTGGSLGALTAIDATHYTALFTPVAADALSASIQVGASGTGTASWVDAAGNNGSASSVLSLAGDTKAPTVTLSADASTLTAGQTANIAFTFSEGVTGFDAQDLSLSGGSLGAITSIDATHYTALFTPVVTASLSASIQVAASGTGTSAWADATGNGGLASNILTLTGNTSGGTVSGPQPQNAHYFGDVIHDPHSAAGEVYALYDAVLHRPSDVGGQNYWTGLHSAGLSLHDLAQGFLDSAEGQSHLGTGDNLSFIQSLYRTALDREGEATGVQWWTSALDQGLSRADAVVSFAFSDENLAGLQPAYTAGIFMADADAGDAARLYYGILNRAPDAGGLEYWTGALKGGLADGDAAQGMLTSNEYQQKYASLTDAAFVDTLYQNALGRQADTGGHDYWTGLLAQGNTRAAIAVGIAQSDEAHQHLMSFIETGWHLV